MSFAFLEHPMCREVATALLHFLWQGAVLLALLELVLLLGRRLGTRGRYAASMVTLALMVACPAVTFCITSGSIQSSVGGSVAQSAEYGSIPGYSRSNADRTDAAAKPIIPHSAEAGMSESVLQAFKELRPVLLLVWVIGVTALGTRLLLGWCGQVWIGNHRRQLPPKWTEHVRVIAGRLGLPAGRVFVSDRVAEAIAVGFWRPVVLIPTAWMAGLPATTLEAIIAHELAHLRRWDLWANLFQRLAETLLFYHPAVWWVSRRATMEREMCCDELAVAATGRRLDYARALEAIAATHVAPPFGVALAVSFSGARQMKVLTRVRNVLGLSVQTRSGLAWPVCMVALAVPVGLSIGVTGSARAADSLATKLMAADGEPKPGPRDGEGPPPRGPRDGEAPKGGPRDGEGKPKPGPRDGAPREGPRDGDGPKRGPGDGEGKPKPGPRDGEKPKGGPRDGEGGKKPGPRDGEGGRKPGPRDGDGAPRPGPRDGAPKSGPRDGAPKEGPRDGERPKSGPRDGEGGQRPGPREGDGPRKPGSRDGEGAKSGPREGDRARPLGEGSDRDAAAAGMERKNRRVFDAYDANRDEEVSFGEWLDMRSGAAENSARSNVERERFGSFDRNDDGVLSFKEFAASRGEGPARPQGQADQRPPREGEGKAGPREGEGQKRGPRE